MVAAMSGFPEQKATVRRLLEERRTREWLLDVLAEAGADADADDPRRELVRRLNRVLAPSPDPENRPENN